MMLVLQWYRNGEFYRSRFKVQKKGFFIRRSPVTAYMRPRKSWFLSSRTWIMFVERFSTNLFLMRWFIINCLVFLGVQRENCELNWRNRIDPGAILQSSGARAKANIIQPVDLFLICKGFFAKVSHKFLWKQWRKRRCPWKPIRTFVPSREQRMKLCAFQVTLPAPTLFICSLSTSQQQKSGQPICRISVFITINVLEEIEGIRTVTCWLHFTKGCSWWMVLYLLKADVHFESLRSSMWQYVAIQQTTMFLFWHQAASHSHRMFLRWLWISGAYPIHPQLQWRPTWLSPKTGNLKLANQIVCWSIIIFFQWISDKAMWDHSSPHNAVREAPWSFDGNTQRARW